MQPAVLYAIVASCMALAIFYYRGKGIERLGWLIGMALAGLVALFSPGILLIADSLSQTIALFLALTVAIVMLSLLINKLLAARLPIIMAKIKRRKEESARGERQEAAERNNLHNDTEEKESKEPGIIDIQEERKRRNVKRAVFSEEYFYEQSDPLEPEIEREKLDEADDWLLTAEAESRAAMDIVFAVEHRQKVTEAQIISKHMSALTLDVEHQVVTEHDVSAEADEDDAAEKSIADTLETSGGKTDNNKTDTSDKESHVDQWDDRSIELLDLAWKQRDAGNWQQSLEAYQQFCEVVEDRRLCMEVHIEQLATMISAGMVEAATDKVFEILSYEEELTDNERQQIIEALLYLQNI